MYTDDLVTGCDASCVALRPRMLRVERRLAFQHRYFAALQHLGMSAASPRFLSALRQSLPAAMQPAAKLAARHAASHGSDAPRTSSDSSRSQSEADIAREAGTGSAAGHRY